MIRPSSLIRIAHIDSDPITIDWMRGFLAGLNSTVEYVGAARRRAEGRELCRHYQPDIVMLEMLGAEGEEFEFCHDLTQLARPPKLLVFTRRADEAFLYWLASTPVAGLVWKIAGADDQLRTAIGEISSGRTFFPREVTEAIRALRRDRNAFSKILSDREISLLPFFGRGDSDAEIAAHFHVEASTIHSHRQRIMTKLGLHRSIHLMRWSAQKGFVQFPLPSPPCETVTS